MTPLGWACKLRRLLTLSSSTSQSIHRWETADIEGVVTCADFASIASTPSRLASMHPISLVVAAIARPESKDSLATFTVPLAAVDELAISASGGWTHGRIHFVVEDELVDKAVVEVVATGNDDQLLQDAHVCQVEDKGKAGLVLRVS